MDLRRTGLRSFLLGLAVAVVTLIAYSLGLFDSWQEKLFDRLYTRQDPIQNIVIIAIDDESLAALGQWPWRRSVFADALEKLESARAVGIDISFSEPSRYGAPDDQELAAALAARPSVLPVQLAPRGKVASVALPEFAATAKLGFVNLPLDADSVSRTSSINENGYPSFAALLSVSERAQPSALYRIMYHGPRGTFLTLPFIDLLDGKIPPQTLAGATVLIGATADDLHDTVLTPFGTMPGVEAHANEIETLSNGIYPHELPKPLGAVLIVAFSFVAVYLVAHFRRLRTLLPVLTAFWLVINLAGLFAFGHALLIPFIYLNTAFLGAAGIAIAIAYATESRERERIRTAFQYYLMPDVIEELLTHPEKLALGGERRQVTILFSDIAGFTTLSEQLSPQELTTLMNEYLTAMTDIILEERGLVDKYIGDAIMAFWGAPVENTRQAEDSCRAAVRMMAKLDELNSQWKQQGLPPIGMRIGIATGEVVVGNMGSARRFNYTVMGDEVNLASRLESLNKAYGTVAMVAEATYTAAAKGAAHGEGLHFRRLGKVRVKGKHEARTIYQLLPNEPNAQEATQLEEFAHGLAAYEHGHWEEAIRHFTAAQNVAPDAPSAALLRQTQARLGDPPTHWDGVCIFDSK